MPRHNMISLGHCPVHHEHIIHILMQLREFFGEKKNGETSAMKQILLGMVVPRELEEKSSDF